MRSLGRLVALGLVSLLVLSAAAGPAVAQPDTDGADQKCFPDGGHELGIGTEGPGMQVVIHTSLFSNLGGAGALGLEARGTAMNATIIELRTGVVFDGVGAPGAFLSNPFARFGVLFDYSFELPMFSGMVDDASYETGESPVTGVESRGCPA